MDLSAVIAPADRLGSIVSPAAVFFEIVPSRAVPLRRCRLDGRGEWRA